ncbi:hypothetical protein L6R29_07055 [Myxococcota bacterium]|nr:hypothetical protein [Myxococcota bacterium]
MPQPTSAFSSDASHAPNPSTPIPPSIEAERDQALREQGRLMAQIEDLSLRLQRAERTSQHARLGWIWMSLLLLFGVSGYWRGYMNPAPPSLGTPDPTDPTTPPPATPAARLSASTHSSPTNPLSTTNSPPHTTATPPSSPSTDPLLPHTPPQTAAASKDPTQGSALLPPKSTENTPPHNTDSSCPEGHQHRCLRPCLSRDARKRCIQQAPQPVCKCWFVHKQPNIRILGIQSNGPIAQTRLQTAARQRMPFFTRCYRNLRDIRPYPPQGEITLRYTIPSFGRPQQAHIGSATLQHASLHSCLLQQVQRMRFRPTPNAAPTAVSLRLAFAFLQPPRSSAFSATMPPTNTPPSHRSIVQNNPSPPNTQPPQPCPQGQIWRCAKPCYQYDEKGQCLAPGPRVKCRCMRPDQRP